MTAILASRARPVWIDARDYGVLADNATDDSTAIQAALDAAVIPVTGLSGNDKSASVVQLPPGYIKTRTTLSVPANVELRGHGPSATYLVRDNGVTGGVAVVKMLTTGVQQTISDLGIIANEHSLDCLQVGGGSGASILSDMRVVVRDVILVGGNIGLNSDSTYGQGNELRCSRVTTVRTTSYGFKINTTDAFFEGCTAQAPGNFGFYIGGGNSRIYGCKAYGGLSDGFNIAGSGRHQLSACEAQDCAGHGFLITGPGTMLSSCVADSCGARGFGIGTVSVVLNACNAVNRGGTPYTMAHALRFEPGSAGGSQVRGFTTNGVKLYYPDFASPSSSVPTDVYIDARNRLGVQAPAYAASLAPDPWAGQDVFVGTLTGNISITAPSTSPDGTGTPYPVGMQLNFVLAQDATGGRTVTFAAVYKTTAAIPTTLSTTTVVKFVFDGTNWREVTRAVT